MPADYTAKTRRLPICRCIIARRASRHRWQVPPIIRQAPENCFHVSIQRSSMGVIPGNSTESRLTRASRFPLHLHVPLCDGA
jgi:hypothetical protein